MTRLFQLAAQDRLDAQWRNAQGAAAVYLGTDPAANSLVLRITNGTGGLVTLPPGTPAAFGSLPKGQGAVYAFFNGLLTLGEVQQVAAGAAGWTAAGYADPATGSGYLVLASASPVQLADGATLELPLENVLAAGAPRSANTDIVVDGATGVTADEATLSAYLNVVNAPAPGSKRLSLAVGFADDVVLTGADQRNELLLYLTNSGDEPLVPGGKWGANPPTFRLSFVCGDRPGALTSVALATQIQVAIAQPNGNVWKPPQPQQLGEVPSWVLQPDPNGGREVLGTGQAGTVVFSASNIVTQLPQGVTYAYLAYSDIPGYDDGHYEIEILKVDPVTVTSFTADPPSVAGALGPTAVTLSFTVANAAYVTVTGTPYAKKATGATFTDTQAVSVATTPTYTLLASNPYTGQQVARSLEVAVSPDVFHLVPTGTVLMWSGSAADVPRGWSVCDGSNGTPDLTGKFVLPAGGSAGPAPHTTGGAATHTHTGSASLTTSAVPDHAHLPNSAWYDNMAGQGNRMTIVDRRGQEVAKAWSQGGGGHAHTVAGDVAVGEARLLPPYYALCFIMKTY